MLSPTIPLQFTSSNAAIETLRPIQLFLYRFAEVGLEVTKEISGTIWAHTRVAAQQVIETTANIALGYFTTSFEIIQRRGGETYNMLNTAIIEFVEADMEHPIHNSSTSSEIGTAIDINGQLLANPCSIGSILAENSAVKTGSSDLNANDIEVVILAGEAVHGSSASGY